MEKYLQSFDVCIVCALPEEARAFLEILRQHGEDPIEECISSRYFYSYRIAILKNDKNEPLKLHISWLPRYGPQEMTLHLSRVLEECLPRITIMTGICAGDEQCVQLGDLVVAERTFTYDNGKFTLDEHGRRAHLHDTMTYQLDANILQFLGLFDEWKPLVARLKRPSYPPEQRKRRKIACHIKAMASGSAVRTDHPFEDVQAPVRGTVAIDMEGAAFGLVMSRHPLIHWLIVKGVCDYADRTKNDAYHDYAAYASALYALRFIQAYVNNERLPRQNEPSPSNRTEPSGVWTVPHRRNPHFTGRDDLLDQLHQQLTPAEQNALANIGRVALTQPQAIKGLGGIGKTQIAVEYAYRSRDQDHYTHSLWVNAVSEETIITSFVTIAELLPSLSAKNESDQRKLAGAVKRWLEQCEQRWLLIFDNADDLPIIQEYLPQRGNGSVLLTTRANAVGSLAASIEVEKMGFLEGAQFLLRRARRSAQASDEDINEAGNIVIALDHFPLALDQAGAYIEETGCNFTDYLQMYQTHRKDVLAQRGVQSTNYPASVATTWSLSFQKVEQTNPAAAELLRLCAFLAPDEIPEELIRNGAPQWSSPLQQAAADLFAFNKMMADLLKFSLVKRLTDANTFTIHRLVQAVQIDMIEPEEQRQWAERVIRAVNDVFPHDIHDTAMWPQCLRYLSQAQMCDTLIEQYTLVLIEAARLQTSTSLYLQQLGLFAIGEPLLQHALGINEQIVGPEHPETAAILIDLGLLYYRQGKYKEAEQFYERALAILGTENSRMAELLNNLGLLYSDQGKYAEAETLLQRALAIKEQRLGSVHHSVATSLNNLALLYEHQGNYAEAEPFYKRALAIREQVLGTEHPETAISLDNLGLFYAQLGKLAEAEPLFQRALAIREQVLGIEHPETAQSLNSIALLNSRQGKHAEAEPLFRRSLAIREQALGTEHPEVAISLNNLGTACREQGRYTEAESLFRRAPAIREQQFGPTHQTTSNTLFSLALLYYRQGRYTEAESLFLRTLAIREQQLGPTHPTTRTTRRNYASLLRSMGREAEAVAEETRNQDVARPS